MRAKTVLQSSLALAALLAAPACKGPKIKSTQSNADLSEAVARVDDQAISVGDLQERINKQSPFIRSRYTSVEKKKEFLDGIVRFEIMAKEAQRKNYDKDPDVIRSMKQQMISKFMQKEFDAKIKVEDVPDADVEKYFKEHTEEFNKQDEVRVSQIFTTDEGKAKKAWEEAKKAPKQDQKAFRDLVEKYSEDADSKARGGDLTFFDKSSSSFAKEFKEASFALADIGDVSPVIKTSRGFHVAKLTQRRPGFTKPLAEVKKQIQQKVFREYRQKAMDEFVNDMKKHIKVEIYEDKLGKVLVDTGLTGGARPGAAPEGAGMSGAPAPGPGGPAAAMGPGAGPAHGGPVPVGRPAVGAPPAQAPKAPGPQDESEASVLRRTAIASAAFGLLAACARPADARVVEKIAAVVGDDVILSSEVEEKAAPFLREVAALTDQQKRSARASAIRREVLDRLIDEQLLLQQATELRLSVSSEEIDKSIEEIKRQNSIDDEQLKSALRGQNMSMTAYRQDLKRQIMRYRVINVAVGSKVTVTDEEVQSYYDRHMKSGGDVQVHAAHIFIGIPEGADAAAVAEKLAAAETLLARARAGEEFGKLARENSEDPATRSDGGDLGTFGKDMLPKPIEELVFAMKPGEVKGPVRADRGFHVIKLIERKVKESKPLPEVKDDLFGKLRQKEMERQTKLYLADLRKKTLVDVRL